MDAWYTFHFVWCILYNMEHVLDIWLYFSHSRKNMTRGGPQYLHVAATPPPPASAHRKETPAFVYYVYIRL